MLGKIRRNQGKPVSGVGYPVSGTRCTVSQRKASGRQQVLLMILFLWAFLFTSAWGQDTMMQRLSFLEPAPQFHPQRFYTTLGTGVGLYTGAMVGLSQLWYSEFERGPFHLYNDWNQWQNIDKAGHLYTAYMESLYAYELFRWTGVRRKPALWMGVGAGMLFQASVEVLDGFSEKWGFSLADIGFNTLGSAAFLSQELLWEEQRISFKVSSSWERYPDVTVPALNGEAEMTLRERADELYGAFYLETFLKDYNRMTIWASVNVASFLPEQSRFPKWLNLAIGYGAANMYGGFENEWTFQENDYALSPTEFPRYQQFYLSPDIDFTRIPTKSRVLKVLFGILNGVKVPAPALELTSRGRLRVHGVYF